MDELVCLFLEGIYSGLVLITRRMLGAMCIFLVVGVGYYLSTITDNTGLRVLLLFVATTIAVVYIFILMRDALREGLLMIGIVILLAIGFMIAQISNIWITLLWLICSVILITITIVVLARWHPRSSGPNTQKSSI